MIVVVAVTERQVAVNDSFATQPLTGGPMAIFNRPPARTETRLDVRVVGVYTSPLDADKARERDEAAHPGCRYEVQQVKANVLPGGPEPVEQHCIDCGTQAVSTRCPACQAKFFAACRDSDPELLEEISTAVAS